MLTFVLVVIVVILAGAILIEMKWRMKRKRSLNKLDSILKRIETRIKRIRETTLAMKTEAVMDSQKWNEIGKRWNEMEKRLKRGI